MHCNSLNETRHTCGRGATTKNAENNHVHACLDAILTRDAIRACQEGEVVIRLDGMNLVVDSETAYELDAEGIKLSEWHQQFSGL